MNDPLRVAPIRVEVVYARPDGQCLVEVDLATGARVREAVEASGLLARHPEIDLRKNRVGVFGKLVTLDTVVNDHDRVEIYRPLSADPKDVRRRRAQGNANKPTRKAGGPPAPG